MDQLPQQLINGLTLGSIYALIALGYTMVYGVLRLINFAHGDVYMLGAFAGFYTAQMLGFGPGEVSLVQAGIILISAMVSCALVGFVIERVAYRPLRRAPRLTALITAIGISLFLEYGGQLAFGTDPKRFPQLAHADIPLLQFGQTILGRQEIITFSVAIILLVILRQIVYRTRVGKAMRAVSFDGETAKLMGINTDSIISITFIIGSAFAGAAGVLVAMQFPSINPMMGLMPGIKAFTAAVLGGIGNVPGAMIGGLAIGITETLVSGYWTSSYRDAVVFGILIFMLLVKPSGLLGRGNVEKV
ncbi:MAG: branched-chain amino acid ABC transporter permease [Armatimonadota bacterium]|nr:branched-chain amino acid ABC transporter permease [Armatimonadota bacterium]